MCFLPADSLPLPSHFPAAIYFLFEVRAVPLSSPFPQPQLKPATPVAQEGTALLRGCSAGGRGDAFWSEVDGNVVWGTACWTADVTFPQSKTLSSSAILLVAAYSFPQTSHFRTSHPHYPDLLVSNQA